MCKRSFEAMLIAFTVFIGAAATSRAADYSVTNINNTGTGSLRQAIVDANAAVGPHTISFNIPGGSSHTIFLNSALPTITRNNVTLDGRTQAGSSCGTVPSANGGISNRVLNIGIVGPTAGSPSQDTMTVTGNNVTIAGVAIVGGRDDILFLDGADNFTLLCSHIGTGKDGITAVPSGNTGLFALNSNDILIGDGTFLGLNVISGNASDGLRISLSANPSINRNFFGLGIDGFTDIGNTGQGLEILATTNAVVSNNVSANNLASGISILGASSSAILLGNYSGTNAAGTTARPNGETGITITSSGAEAIIGNGTVAGRNIVAGNSVTGISINSGTNVSVTGNYIGVGANGTTPLANGASGIFVQGTGIIGGESNGSGNIIANSATNGVTVTGTASIIGNEIRDNTGLGINLSGGVEDGNNVTTNDLGDGDIGANELLNFPVLNSVTAKGSNLIEYDINLDVPSQANGYRIDFYTNSAADPSGHGEGETHLGFIDVAHAGGDLNFTGTITANAAVNTTDYISATTTRKNRA